MTAGRTLGTVMPRPRYSRILFFGPLPPPVTGMAAVNKDITDKLAALCEVVMLNSSTAHARGSFVHILTKALSALVSALMVIVHRLKGIQTLYSSVDDGLGMVGTIMVVSAARLTGMRIFIHHHSYKYIWRRSKLMALLVLAGGAKATHVFLCDAMLPAFRAQYPKITRSRIAPNAIKDAQPREPGPSSSAPRGRLTVGLLSNLTFDKGLNEAIAVVEQCAQKGWDVKGILAGPASTPEADAAIASALERLDGRLDWRGPVYGDDKERFFADIDLFLFPTKYITESFGLVIAEALIRGVPVIAWERGCVSVFRQIDAALILDPSEDFVGHALTRIGAFLDDPRLLADMKAQASLQGRRLNAAFIEAQDQLVAAIVGLDRSDGVDAPSSAAVSGA